MNKLNFTALFLILTLALPFTAQAKTLNDEIPRLYKVNENLYRGGRPTIAGVSGLAKLGVKVIVNLDDDKAAIEIERKNAMKAGIRYIVMSFNAMQTPNDAKVETVLKILRDRSQGPIFVHCKHGEDRTGMIVGLYRVFEDGWYPKTAYKEMKDKGFHALLWKLKNYYYKKTGL